MPATRKTPDGMALRLIRSLLNSKDFSVLIDNGFEVGLLLGKVAPKVYDWVQDFVHTRTTWPTVEAVEHEFSIKLPEIAEDTAYLVEQLKKRRLTLQLSNAVEKIATQIDENDPDAALEELLKLRLDADFGSTSPILSLKDTAEARLKFYDDKAKGKSECILSPWEELNNAIEGFVDGTLNVVLGSQNTGKSWYLCVLANHALKQKKKVLFVTMEMPGIRIMRRLDSIRYKLPFAGLRNASMDPSLREKWEEATKRDTSLAEDILVADKQCVRTVTDVFRLCIQHSPDIVIIDGGYRFEPSQGRSHWEGTVSIVGDLQKYAELSKVPWIVSSQYGDSNETGKEPKGRSQPKMRSWGVRYGKEWVINPDVVIGLYASKEERIQKKLLVYLLKVRDVDEEAMMEYFEIKWDLTEQRFESMTPVPTVVETSVEVEFSA